MQAIPFSKTALAVFSLVILGSCAEERAGGSGFQSQYYVARDALEKGRYDQANRGYSRLLAQSGPFRPRLQLEYAHSELRGGNYAEAARMAADLAASQKGDARAAALAVQGTAQHELALALLTKGDVASGKSLLTSAHKALTEVVKKYPDMDPLGSMAGRRAAIASRLKRL
ncbi:hypothetical protein [Thalassovita sp.]|uniref:hypothetical protein n=1 Tax=Thalassovita sp. TaxID=1979401 RepID=UPI002882A756|nr:hypothetical protein [Thalassovita sp.]MDF1802095.1 hypothetical protein [Thalassovita sp.]